MALRYDGKQPSEPQINKEFSSDIMTTLNNYNELSDGYEFGDLTAMYCGLDQNDMGTWKGHIAKWYPQDVQDEVKRTVVYALTQEDDNGNAAPVPIKFDWKGSAGTVTITYTSADVKGGPSYRISLGYRPPHPPPRGK